MNLILGGAYQGKHDFARAQYGIEQAVSCCENSCEIDFSAPCIDRLEDFCLACVRADQDPVALFEAQRERWAKSVLICRDIFCGVVPLGEENRRLREAAGRLCRYLGANAEHVTRLFCGLPQVLK